MEYDLRVLEDGCREYGICLTEVQKQQFVRYFELLTEWNKVMNLTGITEFQEVLLKHFLDSLSIVKAVNMEQIHTCIDVGTGAGFPGIPLKIAFPHVQVTLLDSLKKRLHFLDEVINELGLEGIKTVHGRAEDGARRAEHREQYDLSVSRAVSRLAALSEYCMPYVREGGIFVSYKSGKASEELTEAKKAISALGGEVSQKKDFKLFQTDMDRTLVVIKKIKATPKKYPRKAGTPAKEPIL